MAIQPNVAEGNDRKVTDRWRWAGLMAALLGVGLLAAACGGGSSPSGVASVGSHSTTTTAPPSEGSSNTNAAADQADAVEYAECMRSHGMPSFPDPTRNSVNAIKDFDMTGISLSSPQYTAANKACSHLLPNGGHPTSADQQQQVANNLKIAQCMRTHGISDFPDPSADGSFLLQGSNLNPNNPLFEASAKACGLHVK